MNAAEIINFPLEDRPVMKADLEDGYLRIANMLIEEMAMSDFSKREYKILLATIRKTYGFQKSADQIALSQYAELTGMDESAVSKALAELVSKNVLIKGGSRFSATYKINTIVSSWNLEGKPGRVYKHRETANCQNNNSTDANGQNNHSELSKRQVRIVKTTTTKENSKNNSKENINVQAKAELKSLQDKAWNTFWTEYPRKTQKKPARKVWDKLPIDRDLYVTIYTALKRQKQAGMFADMQYTPHPTTWLNQERWTDEIAAAAPGKAASKSALKSLMDDAV